MFLGIDLGTGSVKALLLDADGRVIAETAQAYSVNTSQPRWAESDPEQWWRATVDAVRGCTAGHHVDAIGLSGQMHGVVLCDRQGQPLRPAILWADTRSTEELVHYRALSPEQRQRLANPAAVGMAGVSLLWLRAHEPNHYRQAHWALSPKDWLRFRLTGHFHTEPSDASATLMYDPISDDWAFAILDSLGLRSDWLAPLLASAQVAGELTTASAAEFGLQPGISVATGASDTAASLLGSGLVAEGPVQIVIGSGMQILSVRSQAVVDRTLRTHLYRGCGETWYTMAALQNGGIALEWVRALLRLSWEAMYQQGFATAAGAEGLLFLPYLTGERTPHLNPQATGSWLGMRLNHQHGHFARAAFEGVIFTLKDGLSALEQAGIEAKQLRLVGGGSRDPRWRQLLCNVLERPLFASDVSAASARGAALLGGLACGAFNSIEETAALAPKPNLVAEPVADDRLQTAYRRFTAAYGRLDGL